MRSQPQAGHAARCRTKPPVVGRGALGTIRFKAPWGQSLWTMTLLAAAVCVVAALGVGPLPLLILAVTAPFTVRGYIVTDEAILIERLFWSTRLPLDGLQAARAERDAMRGGIRTFGNGGLFSFTGYDWNGRLRHYRAFVTDLDRTVVLVFAKRRVVLSPATPKKFVRTLRANLAAFDAVRSSRGRATRASAGGSKNVTR